MSNRVVAFDLVNTVLDVSEVPRDDVRGYVKHVMEYRRTGIYKPLVLSSAWVFQVKIFPDALIGLRNLQDKGFEVVTCSNLPSEIQWRIIEGYGLPFDGVVPLDLAGVFKTNALAYQAVCLCCRVQPADVTFVTANRDFGDIEASRAIGMTPALIRCEGADYTDLLALAEAL